MRIFRSFKSFLRRTYRHILKRLTKKELIIILSFAVGLIITAAIIFVLKINSPDKTTSDSEDSSLDISIESGDNPSQEGDELTIIETASADTKVESTADTTVLTLKEGAKNGYMNRCVFLGDSRTVAMVNYGLINDDAALAQIGISHPSFKNNTFVNNAGKEYTLKSYLASHQAPVIYVALGVNGINDPSEDHYKNTYNDLIDSIMSQAPNSNIVLMSIGPVDDNGIYKKTVQNSWIDKYNDFLLEMAKEKHIFYLDITEVLKGSNGQVKPEYNGGDGLHYSGSGCQAIFDYIVAHPVPGISDDGEYKVKYIKPNPNNTKITMDDGSGIDEEKLQDLMNMMMETTVTPTPTATATPTAAPTPDQDKEEEERKAREEEEKKAKEAEERRKEEEEEKAAKKAEEDAARRAEEEAAAARKAEEEAEAARKAEKEAEAARKAEEEAEAAKKAEEEAEAAKKSEAEPTTSPNESEPTP